MDKQMLADRIIKAGYEYAKECYEHWFEWYVCGCEEDSPYINSYDTNKNPYEDVFLEQVSEESWHKYYGGELENVSDLNEEEYNILTSDDTDVYDLFWEGVEKFQKEIYK